MYLKPLKCEHCIGQCTLKVGNSIAFSLSVGFCSFVYTDCVYLHCWLGHQDTVKSSVCFSHCVHQGGITRQCPHTPSECRDAEHN